MAKRDSATTARTRDASAPVVPVRLKRSPMIVVLGVACVLLGALAGGWLWLSASTAQDVVAVKASVERGHVVARENLATVRVGVDPALRVIPASQLDSLVGKRAALDMPAGTLVSPDQVTDAVIPANGEAVVAIPVGVGGMPAEPLLAGDKVSLVQTPGNGGEVDPGQAPQVFPATVLNVQPQDTLTVVDVIVPEDLSARVAAWAATGKLSIVLDARTVG